MYDQKIIFKFYSSFQFSKCTNWIKVLCNDCITNHLSKNFPRQKQTTQKQEFKEQSLYFSHRISNDTKGPICPPQKEFRI